jgi:hypothetical protein
MANCEVFLGRSAWLADIGNHPREQRSMVNARAENLPSYDTDIKKSRRCRRLKG